MKEKTDEKSLVNINENSIFFKIKQFFRNLFHKNDIADNVVTANVSSNITADEDKRNAFMEELKKIEDEETLLLYLFTSSTISDSPKYSGCLLFG